MAPHKSVYGCIAIIRLQHDLGNDWFVCSFLCDSLTLTIDFAIEAKMGDGILNEWRVKYSIRNRNGFVAIIKQRKPF